MEEPPAELVPQIIAVVRDEVEKGVTKIAGNGNFAIKK